MEAGFQQATSNNLPSVDVHMIDAFYRRNLDFLQAGVQNVKAQKGSRDTYGDDAIGFVEVRREGKICTIRTKVSPEHKVRVTGYRVVAEINEEILKCQCEDCAASEGGCRHAVALLFWLYRRTSVTSSECYWKKSALSKVGSSIKGETIQAIWKKSLPPLQPKGVTFLNKVVETGLKQQSNAILLGYFQSSDTSITTISLYHNILKYKMQAGGNEDPDEFIEFCKAHISAEVCRDVQKQTSKQSQCKEWYDTRFGRITAPNYTKRHIVKLLKVPQHRRFWVQANFKVSQ